MTWGTFEKDEDIHVCPCDASGSTDHSLGMHCWCGPVRDADDSKVVIHEEG